MCTLAFLLIDGGLMQSYSVSSVDLCALFPTCAKEDKMKFESNMC